MANKRQRVFAGFFAGLFLLTSSALTIGVIWQATQGNKKPDNGATSTPTSPKPKETKLENFTPTTQPQAQLQAIDVKEGTGEVVKAGDTITADYTGALMSTGVVFDASSQHGGPATFPIKEASAGQQGVIAGWAQGVPGMKVGGTRRLLIPAALAYGPQAQSGIPANSDLVFDITLHKIGQ